MFGEWETCNACAQVDTCLSSHTSPVDTMHHGRFACHLYDAVMLYAIALNDTINWARERKV